MYKNLQKRKFKNKKFNWDKWKAERAKSERGTPPAAEWKSTMSTTQTALTTTTKTGTAIQAGAK